MPRTLRPDNEPATVPALPGKPWKSQFRRRLLAWYRRSARDLPWRRTSDPYAVWVSETMLQQTQVGTVVAYYERFLAAFPDLAALAAADEQEVLRHWEGLGYYRRARNLHAAARRIVRDHGGRFPGELELLRRLPGVGRYTAGAILSIALGQRQPILEANTVRLFCRLLAWRGDPARRQGQQLLWALAQALLPRRDPGRFNQALMELGSLVCTPRDPRCADCPVAALCPTFAHALQDQVPRPKRRIALENVHEAAVVVGHGDKVLLVRLDHTGRWAGLWDFPRFAMPDRSIADPAELLTQAVARRTGLAVELVGPLASLKHGVTRFRITLSAFKARRTGGRLRPRPGEQLRWVVPAELTDYAMNTTGRRLSRLVQNGTGGASSRGPRQRRLRAAQPVGSQRRLAGPRLGAIGS